MQAGILKRLSSYQENSAIIEKTENPEVFNGVSHLLPDFRSFPSFGLLSYFNTLSSLPIFVNAAIALSRCCCSCAALN